MIMFESKTYITFFMKIIAVLLIPLTIIFVIISHINGVDLSISFILGIIQIFPGVAITAIIPYFILTWLIPLKVKVGHYHVLGCLFSSLYTLVTMLILSAYNLNAKYLDPGFNSYYPLQIIYSTIIIVTLSYTHNTRFCIKKE